MESVGVDRRYFLTDAIPVSGTSRRGTLAYLFIAINQTDRHRYSHRSARVLQQLSLS